MNDSQPDLSMSVVSVCLRAVLTVTRALAAVACVIALFVLVDITLHGQEATFWSKQNLQTISVQNAFVAICALGMLLIIISGGIDLSAGAILALCACVVAWGMREDAAFVIAHGDNVRSAVARLKDADEAVRAATPERFCADRELPSGA